MLTVVELNCAAGMCKLQANRFRIADGFNWEQGDSGTFIRIAQSPVGSTTSFAQVSFLSSIGSVVSDWLLTPVLTLGAGATFSFDHLEQSGHTEHRWGHVFSRCRHRLDLERSHQWLGFRHEGWAGFPDLDRSKQL